MSTWDAPRLSNKRDNNLPKSSLSAGRPSEKVHICNNNNIRFRGNENFATLLLILVMTSPFCFSTSVSQSTSLGLGMLRLVRMSFYLSTGTNRTLLADLALSSSSLSEKLNLLAVTSVPGVWLAKKIASQTRVVLVLQNIHQHYRSSNPSDITFWCYVHLQDNNKGIAWDVPIQYT